MSMTFFAMRRRKAARAQEASRQKAIEEAGKEDVNVELEKMTVKELKQFVADNGIDIGDARTKTEIMDAIEEAGESGEA